MLKIIIFLCIVKLVLSKNNFTGTSEIIFVKPEDINTPINCARSFNGTISCYILTNSSTTYCKVDCISNNWKYFYTTKSSFQDDKNITTYTSDMSPTETSVFISKFNCVPGYKIIKNCLSTGLYFTDVIVNCKMECKSEEKGSYMYQTEIKWSVKRNKIIYSSIHNI